MEILTELLLKIQLEYYTVWTGKRYPHFKALQSYNHIRVHYREVDYCIKYHKLIKRT